MNKIFNIILLGGFVFISACGGSSSSDSGTLIEGTLTEAGGAAHTSVLLTKHSEGELIAGVTVCALGECSVTDEQGHWGFVLNEKYAGGEVLFDINGHGIESKSIVEITAGAEEVFIDFQHVETGAVEASHVTIDGVTQHNEEHDDSEDHDESSDHQEHQE